VGDRKHVVVLNSTEAMRQGLHVPWMRFAAHGKSWREIGLDAFAIIARREYWFLNSPFCGAPSAAREDGGQLDPALLAQPLGPLDEDYEMGNMVSTRSCGPWMRLVSARDAALRLDWKTAANSLVAAGRKSVKCPCLRFPPKFLPGRIPRAKPEAETGKNRRGSGSRHRVAIGRARDRSELVSGETFTVRVDSHHRGEIAGIQEARAGASRDWNFTKEEPEPVEECASRFLPDRTPAPPNSAIAILPEPPQSLRSARKR